MDQDDRLSSIYAVFPFAVRARLPAIPSIRRSVQNTFIGGHARTRSMPDLRSQSNGLSVNTQLDNQTDGTNLALEASSNCAGYFDPVLNTNNGANGSGVDLQMSELGLRMWLNAYSRAKNDGQLDEGSIRAMHIDAARYINRSLPRNLTALERAMLQESRAADVCAGSTNMPPARKEDVKYRLVRNTLRNATAQLVCMIITLVFFIIPILMTFLNSAFRYEREHQFTEQAVQGARNCIRNICSIGVGCGNGVYKFSESRLGATCGELVVAASHGIFAGVNEGILRSSNGNVRLLCNDNEDNTREIVAF